jgi:hypothetical protein
MLSAEWRRLLTVSWAVEPALLAPLVPAGTALDIHDGGTFLSLVAFEFLNSRVFGVPIPFHARFTEVNFRFYVRRDGDQHVRRGVVFLREIVSALLSLPPRASCTTSLTFC